MMRANTLGWLAAVIAAIGLPLLIRDKPFLQHVVTNIGIFAILATSLNLVSGTTGQLSVGHGAFFMVGAYSSALLTLHLQWPIALALCAGLIASATLSYVIGLVCLRMSGMYLAMVTVAVSLILVRLAIQATGLTGGQDGIPRIPPLLRSMEWGSTVTLWVVFAALLLALRLSWNLIRSHTGRSYFAVNENAIVAASCGIDVARAKIGAFVLSGTIASLSGSLFAHWQKFISPEQFGLHLSLEALLMMLLGGAGTVFGPLIGALVLAPLPELMVDFGELYPFIYGGLLILTAIFLPKGVVGLLAKRRHQMKSSDEVSAGLAEIPLGTFAEAGTALLSVRGLTKSFGGLRAVASLQLEVRSGTIHCLIGPNGSGKTTTVNLITGAVRPDSGSVTFAGADIAGLPPHLLAHRGLRRTFQAGRVLPDMTVLDNVILGAHVQFKSGYWASLLGSAHEKAEDRALKQEAMKLLEFVGLERDANQRAGSLPAGHQRLLELARVLISRPSMIMLDEPAAGLTGNEIKMLSDRLVQLRELGLTIFLVEHNQDLVMSIADRVTVLDHGEVIADGDPSTVRTMPSVVAAYLGADYAPETANPERVSTAAL